MERPKRLCVREINAHLICVLCGGYYVDATTIGECLHSFCRSCIVKYLETNRFCPICDVQLHKAKPLLSIRPDKILQRLVYKIVPGLYANEMQRRRSFYSNTELQSSTDSESCDSYQQHGKFSGHEFFSPEDSISLSLEYYGSVVSSDSEAEGSSTSSKEKKQVPYRRYLQCPAAVTTNHLKKFVRMKYGLTTDHRVDIIYEDECLPDYFSLIDVAYTFSWDRVTPMRFCYRILEMSTIRTTVPNNVIVPEAAPTASSELDAKSGTPAEDNESLNNRTTTDQQVNERVQGKNGLRDVCEEDNNCGAEEDDSGPPPVKKSRLSAKVKDASAPPVVEDNKLNEEEQSESNADDGNMVDATVGEYEDSDEKTEKNNNNDDDNVQTEESVNENEASNGVDGDETPEDFVLQNDQQMDINDDLEEEDDDEDRLRICDPEEDVTEERTGDEIVTEHLEEPMEGVQTEGAVDDQVNIEEPAPQQQPDNEEEEEEEEEEEIKPKEVPRVVELKTRKKNKKGKHHHHHRHRRDYHPAAEILHSDTKNDIMKLKVKLTAVKSDENSKYYKLNSHSPSRHKHYVISEESDNVSTHSQDVSNADDDSRNSQLTDTDVRSVASSKEGGGHDSDSKGSPVLSGHSVSSGSKHDSSSSNKERLLQMRAVRHKNVSSSAKEVSSSSSTNGRTINDMTANKSKSSIILQPPSSITVSKITAAEKRKMDEEKLLMMSGKSSSNGMDNNRPSVEIMLVNAPKHEKTQQGDKLGYKGSASGGSGMPLVNIIKTTAPVNSPSSQRHQSSTVSITSKLHNKIQNNNNVKTFASTANSEKTKTYPSGKTSSTEDSSAQGKRSGGTHDDVGALDLSGKSSRKSSSSSLSPSEGSNCTSPCHNALSAAQTLVQRHLPGLNHSSAGRTSSNSPSEVTTPVAHSSPEPGRSMIPASMWNLMTLSDTAVHIRNMKAAQDGPGSKPQKNMSPQRSLPPPSKSPSAATPNRSSPAPLKIPVPNLQLNNKNITNKNRTLPNLNEITSSAQRTKPGLIHNRNNNNNNIPLNKPGTPMRTAPGISVQPRPGGGLNFSGMLNRQGPSPAVAKKQAGINGRGLLIPPPPPVIPISSILKMENMTRKYDIDKVASGLTAVKAAVEAYGGKL